MKTSWQSMKLNELGFVGRGRSRHRPRNAPFLYGGPYPFFQTGDIKKTDLYLTEYEQTYNEKGLSQSKLWEPGTLCITIAANIAETAILGIKGCFPDSVVGFIANSDKADARFIKYYIDTIKLRMQNVSKGTTQDNLSLDKLLQFDFIVPDLTQQKKIASILSAYDDLIENNTRRIKILEEMARRIYREWFVQFRFPGHEKCRFVDSPLGRIPDGWEIHRLGDLCQENRRSIMPSEVDEKTPYVGLAHIPRKSIALSEWGTVADAESNKFRFYQDEILFGKIRPYFHKVSIAPFDGVCSSDAIVISANDTKWLPIVLMCISSEEFVNHATQTSNGTKMPRANWDVLTEYLLIVPTSYIMKLFDGLIQNSIKEINSLIFTNANLRRTRDLLLPKLINGNVEVL